MQGCWKLQNIGVVGESKFRNIGVSDWQTMVKFLNISVKAATPYQLVPMTLLKEIYRGGKALNYFNFKTAYLR